MDQKLLFLINREWTTPALDWVMAVASSFALWTVPMVLLVIGIAVLGKFRARAFLVTAVLVVGINDGVVSASLKQLVGRSRPFQSLNDVRQVDLARAKTPWSLWASLGKPLKITMSRPDLKKSPGRSFPSSHTMNTISLATVCMAFYGWRGALAYVPALLVGYSRVYTGSHWPSDVFISWFLGFGVTVLLLLVFEWAWRRFGLKVLPRIHAEHPCLFAQSAS